MKVKRLDCARAGLVTLAAALCLTATPALTQSPQDGTQSGDAFMDTLGLTNQQKAGAAVPGGRIPVTSNKGETTYLMSAFNATSQNSLSLFTSNDGATFTTLAVETYKPAKGLLRDPSILRASDGQYYIVYTTGWDGQTFGIARSKDLRSWAHVKDVTIDLPGLTNVWAPEWFRDTDGKVHIVVSLSKGGTKGPFAPHVLTATDNTLTSFTAAQPMQGLENNHIDTFTIKDGDKYVAITKNETDKTLELATAMSLTGPWTIEKTGNWAGWGDWIEGPALTPIKKDGKDGWRIYFDEYRSKDYWYSDSFDGLKTWTPKQKLGGVSGAVRHFTVISEPTARIDQIVAPKPGKQITWDKYSLKVDGERVIVWSGEIHPFRLPSPSLWRDLLQKLKATGYNGVGLYFDWGYHTSEKGSYDFTGIRDMERAIKMAEEEGLYIIVRSGPYVNAELTRGGFPGWLNRQPELARTDHPDYIAAVDEWQTQINAIVARHQLTEGNGNVIAFQLENELGDTSDARKRYMQYLADKARADGITVPLFHNSAGRLPNWTPPESTAPWAVPGPTDLYAFDGYPGGSCTDKGEVGKPNIVPNWGIHGVPKPAADGITKVGALSSPKTPGFAAEIGSGWFDYWGSVGTYECTAKRIGSEYQRLFYGSSLVNGLTIHNVYMAAGGTSWGWLPASVVFTSYDYGSGITEARALRPKAWQLKQMGQFAQAAAPLITHLDKGPDIASTNPNVQLLHSVGAGGEGHMVFAVHNPSNAVTTDDFGFTLTTKDGTYKLPQAGSLRLVGQDARMMLASYALERQHLVYSTSDLQTHLQQGNRDIAIFTGRPGEDGETVLRYTQKPKVEILAGAVTTVYDKKTGDLRLNYKQDGLIRLRISGGGKPDLLLFLGDDAAGQQFWQQETPEGAVLQKTGALIREAEFKGTTLALTGDTWADSPIEIWSPKAFTALTFNDQALTFTANKDGSFTTAPAPGPDAVTVPDLMQIEWLRRADSPEARPDFDDTDWRKADLTTTTATKNTAPPAGEPVLDMSQYGFHHGDVWYRGRFEIKAGEKNAHAMPQTLDVHYGGGGSGILQAWLDGQFIGQSEVPSGKPRPETTAKAQFALPADLKPGPHVLSVMVRNNSHNWDLAADDEHKEARGLISAILSGSPAANPVAKTPITWKIQGNKGGERIADLVRGPMNNGGLYGERQGWHLPYGSKPDTTGWAPARPTDAPLAPGTYWLKAELPLDLPRGHDIQLGLQFGDPSKPEENAKMVAPKMRALIFVNGWNMGNFISHIGPQRTFVLPAGILNPNGKNTIALAITSDGKPENALEPIRLVVMNAVRGGVPLEIVPSPSNMQR